MIEIDTAQVSNEAYFAAEASGSLKRWREKIYQALKELPNSTANEIVHYIRARDGMDMYFDSNSHARFSELRRAGLIVIVAVRLCTTSNRPASVYARADEPGVVAIPPRRVSVRKRIEEVLVAMDVSVEAFWETADLLKVKI